jgi:translation elongation factor EF-1alpha
VTNEDASWYKDKLTLLEAIDTFAPPQRLVEKPFRLSISDVYKVHICQFFRYFKKEAKLVNCSYKMH